MHKVTSTLTVGSIGDLGHIAGALAGAGFNIDAIGGGEGLVNGQGVGVIAMLITPDDDEAAIRTALEGVQLDGNRTVAGIGFHPSFDLALNDQPGQLAGAAGLIGRKGININGIVSVDVHSGWGVVAVGFGSDADRDAARDLLVAEGYTVLDEHGARDRRLWVDEQLGGAQPPV